MVTTTSGNIPARVMPDDVGALSRAEQTLIAELRKITTTSKHTMVIVRFDGIAWQVYKAIPIGRVEK